MVGSQSIHDWYIITAIFYLWTYQNKLQAWHDQYFFLSMSHILILVDCWFFFFHFLFVWFFFVIIFYFQIVFKTFNLNNSKKHIQLVCKNSWWDMSWLYPRLAHFTIYFLTVYLSVCCFQICTSSCLYIVLFCFFFSHFMCKYISIRPLLGIQCPDSIWGKSWIQWYVLLWLKFLLQSRFDGVLWLEHSC